MTINIGRPNVGPNYYHGEPDLEEPYEFLPGEDFENWCRENDPRPTNHDLIMMEILAGEDENAKGG